MFLLKKLIVSAASALSGRGLSRDIQILRPSWDHLEEEVWLDSFSNLDWFICSVNAIEPATETNDKLGD